MHHRASRQRFESRFYRGFSSASDTTSDIESFIERPCYQCHDIVKEYPSVHPSMVKCFECTHDPNRPIYNFTEDRTRLWRGPLGNRHSFALGEEMPDSRRERDALAKTKGVEFTSTKEFLADNKEAANAVDYRKHVDTGGAREDGPAASTSTFVEKPAWAKELTK